MTREDFENKTLAELCEQLEQEDLVTSYEVLKDFAKDNIDNDNMFVASHICEAIIDQYDYYIYDYSMGTLETPTPIKSKDDIVDFIED